MTIISMNSYVLFNYHQILASFVSSLQLRLQFITILLLFIIRSIVLWIQQVQLQPTFFAGTTPKGNGVMLFALILQQRRQRKLMRLSVYVPWILTNVQSCEVNQLLITVVVLSLIRRSNVICSRDTLVFTSTVASTLSPSGFFVITTASGDVANHGIHFDSSNPQQKMSVTKL
jgi:hypothetical protein